jgi:hypothetical protein
VPDAEPGSIRASVPAPARRARRRGQPATCQADPHGACPTRAGGGAESGTDPWSRPPGCQPRGCRGSGKPGRAPPSRERPVLHRSTHPRMSWQYQRTSAHALPPSATSRLTGRRIPHIQQDSTAAPAAVWTIRSSPAMISPLGDRSAPNRASLQTAGPPRTGGWVRRPSRQCATPTPGNPSRAARR